jgi:DNA invertase Pin-like site-specific DNA recombinase
MHSPSFHDNAQPGQIRAAEYLRMSTDGQQYSIANQQAAIRAYAREHAFTIVRTYSDPGKSGLRLMGRSALVQLLTDVQSGDPGFEAILVYDVSRWGRFQDTDESAFYEYLCRRARIRVEYCAEPFRNDSDPLSAILKNIKRIMAAEYSREQSVRVHRATCHVASLGFHAAGTPPYGFRRMLVAADGSPQTVLSAGIKKAIATDRIVLVPGPKQEIANVRRIFRLYTQKSVSPRAIASRLNKEGRSYAPGRPWTTSTVSNILGNEVYVGTNLYNRTTKKLGGGFRHNDPSLWIRATGAFEAIISPKVFEAAQAVRKKRGHREHTDEELLSRLRALLRRHGCLSVNLIRADRQGPHFSIYRRRFGGVRQIYQRIGYRQPRDRHDIAMSGKVYRIASTLARSLIDGLRERGLTVRRARYRGGMVTVNDKVTLFVGAAKYIPTPALKLPCWRLSSKRKRMPNYAVVARMDPSNEMAMDYLVVPKASINRDRTYFGDHNLDQMARWRQANFDGLVAVVAKLGMQSTG